MNTPLSFVFFGTGPLAESVLASLVRNGYTPKLIVTKPDSRSGRHMELVSPTIKVWADLKGIEVYQPETLKDLTNSSPLFSSDFNLFIVASYGKIIPQRVLDIPKHGVLNVHPSLLPYYRGASPIESALLDGTESLGVTIMQLDAGMDHGPLLVQSVIPIEKRDTSSTLEVKAGMTGGDLLTQVLPHFLDGTLIPKAQEHDRATFCKKIQKEDGEIQLSDASILLFRKWQALTPWPGVFFFLEHKDKKLRIKISDIDIEKIDVGSLVKDCILKVIPEGKKEMSFEDFSRGYSL